MRGSKTEERLAISPDVDHLAPDEIIDAYAALPPDEKRRLVRAGEQMSGGTHFSGGELFNEALTRALLGKRRCPRSVDFVAFLMMTMQSIASHDRDRSKRETVVEDVVAVAVADRVVSGDRSRTPEEAMIDAQIKEEIHSHFAEDEKARLLLMGWSEGLRGKDLRDLLGVNQAKLHAVAKQVRRVMERHYPNGWHR